MLTFKELKPTQKQYVVVVMNRFDHKYEDITLDDMRFYHDEMVMTRDQGCPKLGYPNWLIKSDNKKAKGIYNFPRPTDLELEQYHSGDVEAVVDLTKFSPLLNNVKIGRAHV